jgi:hypothetical protein
MKIFNNEVEARESLKNADGPCSAIVEEIQDRKLRYVEIGTIPIPAHLIRKV